MDLAADNHYTAMPLDEIKGAAGFRCVGLRGLAARSNARERGTRESADPTRARPDVRLR